MLKLTNNILSAVALAATAEAFVTGAKGGLDPEVMVQAISAGSGRNSAVDGKFPAAVLTRSFDCGAEMLLLVSRQARKGVGDRGCNTEIHVRDPRRQHVGRKLVPLVGAPCPLRGEVEVGGSVRSHTLSVHSRARLQGRTVAAVPPPLWKLYPQRIGKLRPALRCLKTMHVPWALA